MSVEFTDLEQFFQEWEKQETVAKFDCYALLPLPEGVFVGLRHPNGDARSSILLAPECAMQLAGDLQRAGFVTHLIQKMRGGDDAS